MSQEFAKLDLLDRRIYLAERLMDLMTRFENKKIDNEWLYKNILMLDEFETNREGEIENES